ncbi:hypothetical protein AAHB33_01710 [Paenarthrobacter sp. S56]|uniref:hypothetical protein n=1 Tax=Paenarthrobacter sp. S56 TaxID=3138179 RepID=UPI00321ABB06
MLGILLGAVIALSACAFPLPTAAPPQTSAKQEQSSAVPKPEISADTAPGTGSSSSVTAGVGGTYGEFSSMSDACISVSAAMLSVTILPLAALAGGKPEDIEKAKQELSKMQDKVPAELKPHFEKLRAFTESAGTDFSKYGQPEFEQLIQPIQDWMDKNCK